MGILQNIFPGIPGNTLQMKSVPFDLTISNNRRLLLLFLCASVQRPYLVRLFHQA